MIENVGLHGLGLRDFFGFFLYFTRETDSNENNIHPIFKLITTIYNE